MLRPTGLRLLARLSKSTQPEKICEWLLLARRFAGDAAHFHALLAAAEEGEGPLDVDRDAAAVRDGPIPGGWRLSEAAAFDAPGHSNWCRARSLLTGRAAEVLSPDDIVEKIAERLATEPDPESLGAIRRPLEWHMDPIRQVAWLQTGAGRLRVPMSAVPPPGPGVRFHVLKASGEPVAFTAEELLAAFPELRGPPAPAPAPGSLLPATPVAPPSLAASPRPRVAASDLLEELPDSGPLPARWPPRVVRNLAASSGRCLHVLRFVQVEAITELVERASGGSPESAAALDGLRASMELSGRDLDEAARVGRHLRRLPRLREAFAAGSASYTKVRAVVRKATPRSDSRWADFVRRLDTAGAEALAAATPYGQYPPLVPDGMDPLLPEGFLVRERVHVTLRGTKGEAFARLRAALNRLAGRTLSSGEGLGLLAGWFLRLEAPRARDVVIYQRSPESRVPVRAAALMAPALREIPDVGDRLDAAFPHLRQVLRDPCRARRSLERIRRAEERARSREGSAPTKCERDLVRWRDGDVCIVPGCRNSLVVQYDHGLPVSLGGRADVRWDHRLCGPCNRAKHLGEIEILTEPDGTVRVTDRDGILLGSGEPPAVSGVEPLGLELDRPLLEKLWAAASSEVAARMAAPAQPGTLHQGLETGRATLSSTSEALPREPEDALTAVF